MSLEQRDNSPQQNEGNMRKLLVFVISFFCFSSFALEVDKGTATALNLISQGYVQYGFSELKKIANTNAIAAQFYVAVCYEQGIGVEQNAVEAFKMYRKAAERGLPDAMYHIASFYKEGVVVSQDTSREKEWLERFNQKGGELLLPDIISLYNEGLKYPDNYALNPNGGGAPANNVGQKVQTINSPQRPRQNPVQAQQLSRPVGAQSVQTGKTSVAREIVSDVDRNIPVGQQKREKTFALIIANENYQEEENVPNAINDGAIFTEYCKRTLGIPQNNIKFIQDATLNGIKRQISWLSQVMEAYQGEACIIFYYAGHGIPDESTRSSYLLPVDGYGTDVSTGYSLDKVYAELTAKPAKSVVVLLDACFSGAKRDGGMLASSRGVAIKAKQNQPTGNLVVLSAAKGDETAYPFKEKGHGMFTYYLLKKLQDTKGNVTFGELANYVTSEVKKQSIVLNGKMQTPTVSPSGNVSNWMSWTFK